MYDRQSVNIDHKMGRMSVRPFPRPFVRPFVRPSVRPSVRLYYVRITVFY